MMYRIAYFIGQLVKAWRLGYRNGYDAPRTSQGEGPAL
jgi:hypothetical protein